MTIRFLKLSLASPQSIKSWTERVLPDGKRVGKILKGDLIDYKNGLPVRDGLSCERIFGPVVSFTCSCGRFKCIETRGIHVVHDTLRTSRPVSSDLPRQTKPWTEKIQTSSDSAGGSRIEVFPHANRFSAPSTTPIEPNSTARLADRPVMMSLRDGRVVGAERPYKAETKMGQLTHFCFANVVQALPVQYSVDRVGMLPFTHRHISSCLSTFVAERLEFISSSGSKRLWDLTPPDKKIGRKEPRSLLHGGPALTRTEMDYFPYQFRSELGGVSRHIKISSSLPFWVNESQSSVMKGTIGAKLLPSSDSTIFAKNHRKWDISLSGIRPLLHPGPCFDPNSLATRASLQRALYRFRLNVYIGFHFNLNNHYNDSIYEKHVFFSNYNLGSNPSVTYGKHGFRKFFSISNQQLELGTLFRIQTWPVTTPNPFDWTRFQRDIPKHNSRIRVFPVLSTYLTGKTSIFDFFNKSVTESTDPCGSPQIPRFGAISQFFDIALQRPVFSGEGLSSRNKNSLQNTSRFSGVGVIPPPIASRFVKRQAKPDHRKNRSQPVFTGTGISNQNTTNSKSGNPDKAYSYGDYSPVETKDEDQKSYRASDIKQNVRVYKFKNFPPEEIRYCPHCEVELLPNSIRRYRLGYIEFVSPVAHIWYTANSIPLLLNLSKTRIERIASCHEALSSGFPPIYRWSYNGESPTSWTFQMQPLKLPINFFSGFSSSFGLRYGQAHADRNPNSIRSGLLDLFLDTAYISDPIFSWVNDGSVVNLDTETMIGDIGSHMALDKSNHWRQFSNGSFANVVESSSPHLAGTLSGSSPDGLPTECFAPCFSLSAWLNGYRLKRNHTTVSSPDFSWKTNPMKYPKISRSNVSFSHKTGITWSNDPFSVMPPSQNWKQETCFWGINSSVSQMRDIAYSQIQSPNKIGSDWMKRIDSDTKFRQAEFKFRERAVMNKQLGINDWERPWGGKHPSQEEELHIFEAMPREYMRMYNWRCQLYIQLMKHWVLKPNAPMRMLYRQSLYNTRWPFPTKTPTRKLFPFSDRVFHTKQISMPDSNLRQGVGWGSYLAFTHKGSSFSSDSTPSSMVGWNSDQTDQNVYPFDLSTATDSEKKREWLKLEGFYGTDAETVSPDSFTRSDTADSPPSSNSVQKRGPGNHLNGIGQKKKESINDVYGSTNPSESDPDDSKFWNHLSVPLVLPFLGKNPDTIEFQNTNSDDLEPFYTDPLGFIMDFFGSPDFNLSSEIEFHKFPSVASYHDIPVLSDHTDVEGFSKMSLRSNRDNIRDESLGDKDSASLISNRLDPISHSLSASPEKYLRWLGRGAYSFQLERMARAKRAFLDDLFCRNQLNKTRVLIGPTKSRSLKSFVPVLVSGGVGTSFHGNSIPGFNLSWERKFHKVKKARNPVRPIRIPTHKPNMEQGRWLNLSTRLTRVGDLGIAYLKPDDISSDSSKNNGDNGSQIFTQFPIALGTPISIVSRFRVSRSNPWESYWWGNKPTWQVVSHRSPSFTSRSLTKHSPCNNLQPIGKNLELNNLSCLSTSVPHSAALKSFPSIYVGPALGSGSVQSWTHLSRKKTKKEKTSVPHFINRSSTICKPWRVSRYAGQSDRYYLQTIHGFDLSTARKHLRDVFYGHITKFFRSSMVRLNGSYHQVQRATHFIPGIKPDTLFDRLALAFRSSLKKQSLTGLHIDRFCYPLVNPKLDFYKTFSPSLTRSYCVTLLSVRWSMITHKRYTIDTWYESITRKSKTSRPYGFDPTATSHFSEDRSEKSPAQFLGIYPIASRFIKQQVEPDQTVLKPMKGPGINNSTGQMVFPIKICNRRSRSLYGLDNFSSADLSKTKRWSHPILGTQVIPSKKSSYITQRTRSECLTSCPDSITRFTATQTEIFGSLKHYAKRNLVETGNLISQDLKCEDSKKVYGMSQHDRRNWVPPFVSLGTNGWGEHIQERPYSLQIEPETVNTVQTIIRKRHKTQVDLDYAIRNTNEYPSATKNIYDKSHIDFKLLEESLSMLGGTNSREKNAPMVHQPAAYRSILPWYKIGLPTVIGPFGQAESCRGYPRHDSRMVAPYGGATIQLLRGLKQNIFDYGPLFLAKNERGRLQMPLPGEERGSTQNVLEQNGSVGSLSIHNHTRENRIDVYTPPSNTNYYACITQITSWGSDHASWVLFLKYIRANIYKGDQLLPSDFDKTNFQMMPRTGSIVLEKLLSELTLIPNSEKKIHSARPLPPNPVSPHLAPKKKSVGRNSAPSSIGALLSIPRVYTEYPMKQIWPKQTDKTHSFFVSTLQNHLEPHRTTCLGHLFDFMTQVGSLSKGVNGAESTSVPNPPGPFGQAESCRGYPRHDSRMVAPYGGATIQLLRGQLPHSTLPPMVFQRNVVQILPVQHSRILWRYNLHNIQPLQHSAPDHESLTPMVGLLPSVNQHHNKPVLQSHMESVSDRYPANTYTLLKPVPYKRFCLGPLRTSIIVSRISSTRFADGCSLWGSNHPAPQGPIPFPKVSEPTYPTGKIQHTDYWYRFNNFFSYCQGSVGYNFRVLEGRSAPPTRPSTNDIIGSRLTSTATSTEVMDGQQIGSSKPLSFHEVRVLRWVNQLIVSFQLQSLPDNSTTESDNLASHNMERSLNPWSDDPYRSVTSRVSGTKLGEPEIWYLSRLSDSRKSGLIGKAECYQGKRSGGGTFANSVETVSPHYSESSERFYLSDQKIKIYNVFISPAEMSRLVPPAISESSRKHQDAFSTTGPGQVFMDFKTIGNSIDFIKKRDTILKTFVLKMDRFLQPLMSNQIAPPCGQVPSVVLRIAKRWEGVPDKMRVPFQTIPTRSIYTVPPFFIDYQRSSQADRAGSERKMTLLVCSFGRDILSAKKDTGEACKKLIGRTEQHILEALPREYTRMLSRRLDNIWPGRGKHSVGRSLAHLNIDSSWCSPETILQLYQSRKRFLLKKRFKQRINLTGSSVGPHPDTVEKINARLFTQGRLLRTEANIGMDNLVWQGIKTSSMHRLPERKVNNRQGGVFRPYKVGRSEFKPKVLSTAFRPVGPSVATPNPAETKMGQLTHFGFANVVQALPVQHSAIGYQMNWLRKQAGFRLLTQNAIRRPVTSFSDSAYIEESEGEMLIRSDQKCTKYDPLLTISAPRIRPILGRDSFLTEPLGEGTRRDKDTFFFGIDPQSSRLGTRGWTTRAGSLYPPAPGIPKLIQGQEFRMSRLKGYREQAGSYSINNRDYLYSGNSRGSLPLSFPRYFTPIMTRSDVKKTGQPLSYWEANQKVSESYLALLRKAKILEDYPIPDPIHENSITQCLSILNGGMPRFGPNLVFHDLSKADTRFMKPVGLRARPSTEPGSVPTPNPVSVSPGQAEWSGNQVTTPSFAADHYQRLFFPELPPLVPDNITAYPVINRARHTLPSGYSTNWANSEGPAYRSKEKGPIKRREPILQESRSHSASSGRNLRKLRLQYLRNFRRLRFIEYLKATYIKPEWMILSLLPVLPPDLRPVIANPRGYITGDINTHYQNVIYRNNNIEKLLDTFWIPRKFYNKTSFSDLEKKTVSSMRLNSPSAYLYNLFSKQWPKRKKNGRSFQTKLPNRAALPDHMTLFSWPGNQTRANQHSQYAIDQWVGILTGHHPYRNAPIGCNWPLRTNPQGPGGLGTPKKMVPFMESKTIRTQVLHDSKPLQEMQYSLQKAVDALMDNSQKLQSNILLRKGRPLKSLSDNLKGKEGRFRQHLLGKRVDYSGRSVIVVGPDLKLYECGIPLIMALRLFQPFLILYLIYRFKIASLLATQLIQRKHPMVINLLKRFIETWPILLNRAPTLHRMNIQAFKIRLVQGKAILLHPLVCSSYNADFDGDQMGVHVPITQQARAESWKLLWSINNSIAIASRQPLFLPSQDMVIGNYYLTQDPIVLNRYATSPHQQHLPIRNLASKKTHNQAAYFSLFNQGGNPAGRAKDSSLRASWRTRHEISLPQGQSPILTNHYFFSIQQAYEYYLNTAYRFHVNTPVWFCCNMVFETSEREKPIEITLDKSGNSIYIARYYEKQLKRNRILRSNRFDPTGHIQSISSSSIGTRFSPDMNGSKTNTRYRMRSSENTVSERMGWAPLLKSDSLQNVASDHTSSFTQSQGETTIKRPKGFNAKYLHPTPSYGQKKNRQNRNETQFSWEEVVPDKLDALIKPNINRSVSLEGRLNFGGSVDVTGKRNTASYQSKGIPDPNENKAHPKSYDIRKSVGNTQLHSPLRKITGMSHETNFDRNLNPICLNQIIRSTFGRIEFYYEAFSAPTS